MHTSGEDHPLGPRPEGLHPPLWRRLIVALLIAGLVLGLAATRDDAAGAATTTGVTARASVTTAGTGLADTVLPLVLADETGRLVAFSANAPFATGDTNATLDVFLRDRLTGTTTRVSLTDADAQISGPSILCGASADLRHLAFVASGSNLAAGGSSQIYLRDRVAGTTQLVSIGAGGLPSTKPGGGSGIDPNGRCDVSGDGRYVAFASEGSGFVADGNGVSDVFRRDMTQAVTTTRASVTLLGGEITGFGATDPQMSDDGDRILFVTKANLSGSDGNGATDVFLRTVSLASTAAVSVRPNLTYGAGASSQPAISGDGTVVAYTSQVTDLVLGEDDENGFTTDVYVLAFGGTTTRESVSSTEIQGAGASTQPSLSETGRYLAFTSAAAGLWPLDGNGTTDAFLRDRELGLTSLASRRNESSATSVVGTGGAPSVAADGTAVAFASSASDLVRNDTNGARDAFVRDTDVSHTPFGSFDALVVQQFADFAGRAPTTAEATSWRERLRHGEVSPDQVVNALAHSNVWSQHRGPVARLYWAFFLRAPDKGGLDYWVAQKAAGKGLHTIAGQFAQSKEFKDTYGSLTNSAFVTLVYQNVLQRDPAPNEVAYWSGQLSSGAKTRGSVMVGFSESAEGRVFLAPQVDVVLIHLGMLGTIPGTAGFTELAGLLADGAPPEWLILLIRTNSIDYQARVD